MVEYKEFRVGDLFEPVLNTSRTLQKQEVGEYPLVCGSGVNNGRDGFTDVSDVVYENEITISTRGSSGSTFYQKGPFVLNNNAMVLKAKFEKRHRVLLYIARNIGSLGYNGYQHYPTKRGIVDDLILLPVTPQGTPDFDFMENYIKEIEQKHIKKLESDLATRTENLLTVIGREDLVGDPDGLVAVVDKGFDVSGVEYAEFRVGELFESHLSTRGNKEITPSGEYPVISGVTENNGVIGFTDEVYDKDIIFEKILTISNRGAKSGTVFYHPYKFVLSNNVIALDNKFEISERALMYIATLLNKLPYNSYSNYPTKSGILKDIISLPVTPSGTPNFDFMEQYIAHIELKYTHILMQWSKAKELL